MSNGHKAKEIPNYEWELKDFSDSALIQAEVKKVSECLNRLPYDQILKAIDSGIISKPEELRELSTFVDNALIGIKCGPIGDNHRG